MVVLEEPYVSEMLTDYLAGNDVPVLENDYVRTHCLAGLNVISPGEFKKRYGSSNKIYTVSENALEAVYSTLKDPLLNRQVALLKDKAAFREACRELYPGFFFREVGYTDLFSLDASDLQFPFVLKPSVGFLSAGVFTVFDRDDWDNALRVLDRDFKRLADNFPDVVLKGDRFILESYIEGAEYAVDVYFRGGEPVIVNIFEHPFSSGKDVSDRLYFTNKGIFDRYLEPFTQYFRRLNRVLGLDHIPVHVEMRVDRGDIIPIEINPLRFTGMCLNELNYYITGKHPLHYYLTDTAPDYAAMWEGKEGETFCFSILEKGADAGARHSPESLRSVYSNILEWREVANPKLDIQAFVFSKTTDPGELGNILSLKV